MRPAITISLGDPGGIGPEVIAKSLADDAIRARAAFVVRGPVGAMLAAAHRAGIGESWLRDVEIRDYPWQGGFENKPNASAGEASFRAVEFAIADALTGESAAVVTGPINKLAWKLAGHGKYPGHTELLAERCDAPRHGMMFVSPRLRVILATTHIALMDVRKLLTVERVLNTIELGRDTCVRLGIARPRIAVCGLNPHAGEEGLMGDDESRVIGPAIRAAAERGIDARGPFPGDTIFNAAVRGDFDLVVAMYHDQGLIPVKLLDRDRAVNISVGLPMVRTSPDHGTAFDIAGQNKADPGSMKAAIELALKLVGA